MSVPPVIVDNGIAGPDDLYWELRAQKLEREALASIRGTASKWAASIASLTGVFSIVALIKGRENIAELARGWEIAVGVLIAAGIGLAAIGIALAALAAQGVAQRINFTGDAVRQAERRQATSAANALALSRLTAILAVLVVGIAIGLTWAGPARPTPVGGSGQTTPAPP